MHRREISVRSLTAVAVAASAFTLLDVAWGFATPGDYFANGSALYVPTVLLATVAGLVAGFLLPARLRVIAVLATLVSVCYWVFVPSDWWVKPLYGPPP